MARGNLDLRFCIAIFLLSNETVCIDHYDAPHIGYIERCQPDVFRCLWSTINPDLGKAYERFWSVLSRPGDPLGSIFQEASRVRMAGRGNELMPIQDVEFRSLAFVDDFHLRYAQPHNCKSSCPSHPLSAIKDHTSQADQKLTKRLDAYMDELFKRKRRRRRYPDKSSHPEERQGTWSAKKPAQRTQR